MDEANFKRRARTQEADTSPQELLDFPHSNRNCLQHQQQGGSKHESS